MIKEIAAVTDKDKYTCVRTLSQDDADKYNLSVVTLHIEPDTFVDDDFSAEVTLVGKLVGLHESEHLNIRWQIPEGRSKFEHYNDIISEAEEVACMKLFMNTKRFRPNYVIVSSDMVPIFHFCYDYKPSEVDWTTPCTYVAGTYRDLPVLVSQVLTHHEMIWGVNNEITPGVVAFAKDNKICYKIANPSNFVYLKLED